MTKKIDERLPREVGSNALPLHAGVKSPWEKIVSYHDAVHYCQRYTAVVGASMMQVLRLLVPDYVERSKALCKNAYNRLEFIYRLPGVASASDAN